MARAGQRTDPKNEEIKVSAMTLTQIGLSMDIVGFMLIIPIITMTKTGIPYEPVVGQWRWWQRLIGVSLVVLGFVFQLVATF